MVLLTGRWFTEELLHKPTQLKNTIQWDIFLLVQWGAEIPGIDAMLYLLSLYSLLVV